jgi:hypothetical protein
MQQEGAQRPHSSTKVKLVQAATSFLPHLPHENKQKSLLAVGSLTTQNDYSVVRKANMVIRTCYFYLIRFWILIIIDGRFYLEIE